LYVFHWLIGVKEVSLPVQVIRQRCCRKWSSF